VFAKAELSFCADDYETSRLMTRPNLSRTPKNLVYYSLDRDNELLQRHVADGGVAFTIEDGQICEVNSQGHFPIVHVEDLPFTMNGTAEFQVSNALASSAAGRALGLSRSQVAQGLSTFNNVSQNSGRANLYQVGKGYLMLDYGHNTDAISAIGRMSEQWAGFTTTAVIGLPGDRSDDILRAASREAAKHFDRIIARDDYNRRGRAPLEIPNLIRQVVAEVNPNADFRIIAEEDQALDFALGNIREREVVILFYDELETTLETIKRFDPIPISELPLKQVASELGAEMPSRRQTPQAATQSNGASWAH
jgi:cyanophycin synthetase